MGCVNGKFDAGFSIGALLRPAANWCWALCFTLDISFLVVAGKQGVEQITMGQVYEFLANLRGKIGTPLTRTSLVAVREAMNTLLVPMEGRNLLISSTQEGDLLNVDNLITASHATLIPSAHSIYSSFVVSVIFFGAAFIKPDLIASYQLTDPAFAYTKLLTNLSH